MYAMVSAGSEGTNSRACDGPEEQRGAWGGVCLLLGGTMVLISAFTASDHLENYWIMPTLAASLLACGLASCLPTTNILTNCYSSLFGGRTQYDDIESVDRKVDSTGMDNI